DGGLPEDLAALCMQLLARDPQQRPDTFEIAKRISSGLQPAAPGYVGPAGHHLVGREGHLAALADAYRTMQRQEQPQAVWVLGRSGEGKTALAEHFLGPLRADPRVAVMAGRCYDRESVPFKALDS